jgi:amidohydrolase
MRELYQEISQIIKEVEPEVVELRRDFHRFPETGFEEERTAGVIIDNLKKMGVEVKKGIAKTGVIGLIKGKKEKPVIALRADMDALTITEQNQIPYASKEEGKMHACGHDAHVAILLGVARVLSQIKDHLPGQVKLIFQPAEEGPGGAWPMIEEGALKEPDVDVILGLHVWMELPVGTIGVKAGPAFAAVDEFDLTLTGKSSHGARPQDGIDTIIVAANLINALQSIVSRNIDPIDSAVITIGKIEGGYRRNIIVDRVRLEGTCRSLTPEVRDRLEKRLKEVIKGVCSSYGCEYELDYRREYPPLINDGRITDRVKRVAEDILGKEKVIEIEKPTLGGEDFAFFLQKVPGSFFLVGARNEEKGITAPHHNPYFNIDEDCLAIGVEVLVKTVLDFL